MKRTGIMVAAALFASTAFGATDGLLGLTSTGTVDISLAKGFVVQITGLLDFTVPLWTNGDGDVELTQDVCMYTNNGAGDYLVTTTSANAAGGQWRLFDGGINYVTYDVGWVDSPGGNMAASTAGGAFASGAVSVNQTNAETADPTCALGQSATLVVFVAQAANLGLAPNGVYTDTLTVVVQPN